MYSHRIATTTVTNSSIKLITVMFRLGTQSSLLMQEPTARDTAKKCNSKVKITFHIAIAICIATSVHKLKMIQPILVCVVG